MPKGKAAGWKALVGRLVALALVLGLLAGAEIWRSYGRATLAAERSVISLVRLLAEQTERTIQAIDFTLIGMRDALLVAPSLPPNDRAFRTALGERLKSLPYARSLFVVGPDGFVTHGSHYPATQGVSLADRPYFQFHREDADGGLHIGQPLRSRLFDGWFVSLSRRINNPDGSFGGIVVAGVEPRYFQRLYRDLSAGEDKLIALLLSDGTLLARTPDHEEAAMGKPYSDGLVHKLAVEQGSGITWSTGSADRVTRVMGYRTLAGGSLIVVVGRPESTVFNSWVEHAAVVSGGSLLVWGLASVLTWLSLKSRRREQMEQERLAQAQRLETMGRIAGGVAHDLGNTVKIARTTFTLLKPSLAGQQDAMALVEEADRSLKSAFDIIDRLLAFARRQELSPRATDLGELISGFAPILRQAAGPRVQLDLDLAGGKPLICVIDPIQLESALLNLVLNSKDAMPHGGSIRIELGEAQAPRDRRKGAGRQLVSEPWARIAVKDSGSGMSREVVDRAFEPFFTTKTDGSGLGLSQVLGFVQQSAGEITIESREDGGTTVTLLFATISDPARSPAPSTAAAVG